MHELSCNINKLWQINLCLIDVLMMLTHLLSLLQQQEALPLIRLPSKVLASEIDQSITLTAECMQSRKTRTSSWSSVLITSLIWSRPLCLHVSPPTPPHLPATTLSIFSSSCSLPLHTHPFICLHFFPCNSFDTSFSPLPRHFIFTSSLTVLLLLLPPPLALETTHTRTRYRPHSLRP